ncbi:hypothetical protein [Paracoccus sp. ME4]|uniref:hypothetical protein n=1 Tax=Paracoccus sp. ME4 TaxID=3138066 RepID=UPI00398B1CC1
MTTERLTDEARQTGWLIHKEGRGWYRPNAQGYTSRPEEAGRYSYKDALSYSHPNGWSGPRDGITIRHESDIGRRATPAGDLRAWRDGAPPSGADVAWLLVESPDGDGGTTLEVFLGCHDGEWWSNAADYKGESYDDYIIGNVIAWQPHYVPKPTRAALSQPADDLRTALEAAERFISGFEGDEAQDGIADLLWKIRAGLEASAVADCGSFSAGYEAGERDGKAERTAVDWNAALAKLQALKTAARQAGLQERLDGIRDAEDAVRALRCSHEDGFTDRQLRDQIVGEG